MPQSSNQQKIVVQCDGPYRVEGGIPLVKKTQVVSDFGEPLTWQTGESLPVSEEYLLCRCGQSRDKPFCDGTHNEKFFDGTETASAAPTRERQETYPGSTGIVVRRDHSLCSEAGFCGTRFKNIEQLSAETGDTQVRALVMGMIERCPSGSLTYALAPGQPDVEPDLPAQIAVTTEITSSGPINGPLWVSGSIPVERSDGALLEARSRVTLCNCGKSENKPLCDGSHRAEK